MKQIDTLLKQEMSRKEFLAAIGMGIAAIMGFSHLIRLLTGKDIQSPLQGSTLRSNGGYGASVYGGSRKTSL